MSIRSMTGYGTAESRADGWIVSVEARSVNHRNLDTRVSVPRECPWLEPQITQLLRDRLHRGRVQINVNLEFDQSSEQIDVEYVDRARFDAIAAELRELGQASGTVEPSLGDVLEFRHLFEKKTIAEISTDNPALMAAARNAVDMLIVSRATEGDGIAEDLLGHLENLGEHLDELRELLPREIEEFRGRLRERIDKAVEDFDVGSIDDDRLAQELAYYVDKADVSEELQRATSHVEKLRRILDSDEREAVGKTIDFYLQELIRETNTMGSKSNSARGTDIVIAMKSAVEKMREQAANIE